MLIWGDNDRAVYYAQLQDAERMRQETEGSVASTRPPPSSLAR